MGAEPLDLDHDGLVQLLRYQMIEVAEELFLVGQAPFVAGHEARGIGDCGVWARKNCDSLSHYPSTPKRVRLARLNMFGHHSGGDIAARVTGSLKVVKALKREEYPPRG